MHLHNTTKRKKEGVNLDLSSAPLNHIKKSHQITDMILYQILKHLNQNRSLSIQTNTHKQMPWSTTCKYSIYTAFKSQQTVHSKTPPTTTTYTGTTVATWPADAAAAAASTLWLGSCWHTTKEWTLQRQHFVEWYTIINLKNRATSLSVRPSAFVYLTVCPSKNNPPYRSMPKGNQQQRKTERKVSTRSHR